ncbi:MAG: acyltransferase family protein [Burkholderiales bacterium]
MNRSFSLYLDLVRFIAACLVYLYHSNQRWLVSEVLPASHFGHSAVVVFFVLSGYVIAYVTATKEKDWASYTASRLSRVYSVAVPAVVLTLLLDMMGRSMAVAHYDYPWDQFVLRSGAALAMLNEVWFVSITTFSNVPYWSICYESWYYLAFGVLWFAPRRWAIAAVLLMALLLGPKIVLLAPLWALGVWLFHSKRLNNLPTSAAWVMVVASTVLIVVFHALGVSEVLTEWLKKQIGEPLHTQLTFSKFFLGDYLLGILVVANFAGMRQVADTFWPLFKPVQGLIRWLAGFTFTLYLLHQPLFLFWGSWIAGDPKGHAFWWMTTAAVAVSVVAIGWVTESKRGLLRSGILRVLQVFSKKQSVA